MMGERVQSQVGESSYGLPYGTQSSEEQVWSIPVNAKTQFASNLPQPLHRYRRPLLHQVEDELSSHQHQREQSPHPLHGLHSHIFHVQTLFLVEAVAMLNATA